MESTHSGPRSLGDFEIIREIGRGGMGIVYEARQTSLNRRVALKVLSSGLGLTTKAVTRFRREAEAAAKLHHTNIVPIYATGEEHGIHFYAMELIDGPSLDQVIRHMRDGDAGMQPMQELDSTVDSSVPAEMPNWISETMAHTPAHAEPGSATRGKASDSAGSGISSGTRYFDQVAHMIADVADALQHAHDEGVIHRDIKPSNLLLSTDGRLSLNDFGLARVLEQPGMTMSGEFVGSPLYMSPEQITAGRAPLDHRTDVYSLGATLYELLTLRPPFPGQQRDQVIGQILHKDPVPPRRSNRHVPIDLETICLKAMEKDPDRRYQTARQMADDLRRFVNRFAISAKRTGPIGRAAKWARRHPAVAGLSGLLVISLCVASWLAYTMGRARLEKATEDTFLDAMSGDLVSAQTHLEEAERLGASQGWLHLMRGQIAALNSEHETAIMELEQATSLLDNSTAAYGMLTAAYFLANDEDQYFMRLPHLEELDAVEFYDYLLKAWAESWAMPRQAKANIEVARRLRPHSLVAMLIEAEVLREYSLDMLDARKALPYAQDAVERGNAVRQFLPGNALAIADNVMAQLVWSKIFCELGDDQRAADIVESLAVDVDRLADFPGNSDAELAAATYYLVTGQDDRAIRDFERAKKARTQSGDFRCMTLAIAYYRKGDYQGALNAYARAGRRSQAICQFIPMYVKMATLGTHERSGLVSEFRIGLDQRQQDFSGTYLLFDWTVLRMLGEQDGLQGVAQGFRDAYTRVPHREAWVQIGDYMLGTVGPEALVERCQQSRSAKSYAHFTIAIDMLARGDRHEARRQFEACVATHSFTYYSYWWSRAFLDRLSDPKWLPWLPNNQAPVVPQE